MKEHNNRERKELEIKISIVYSKKVSELSTTKKQNHNKSLQPPNKENISKANQSKIGYYAITKFRKRKEISSLK